MLPVKRRASLLRFYFTHTQQTIARKKCANNKQI